MSIKEELLKTVIGAHERERLVEYPFTFKYLERNKILDIGCLESQLCWALGKLGYEVTGVDIRPYPTDYPKPEGWTWRQCDGRMLPFLEHEFDQVISVSTTEHIGLKNAYNIENIVPGYTPTENGDRENVLEMKRVTRYGGSIILTVPVGWPCHYWMRVYTKSSLAKLIEGFKVEVMEFYLEQDKKIWIPSYDEEAFKRDSIPLPKAVVCMLLRC